MRRAVIFLWDGARRTVRVAGSYEVDISVFADDFVNVDVLPAARQALEFDEVVESTDHPVVSERYGALVNNRTLIVTPMVAGVRWVGVVIGDRLPDAGPLIDAERQLLWSLGKTAALAATARSATRQAMRARELEARIDLAREIHERVVQRLFGVSLALSGEGELDAETRERCARGAAGGAAGSARRGPAAARPPARRRRARRSSTSCAGSSASTRDLGLRLVAGDAGAGPRAPRAARAVGARRGDPQRAASTQQPTMVDVSVARADGTLVLEVVNDGARERSGGRTDRAWACGSRRSRRSSTADCSSSARAAGRRWQVRLAVPDG